MIVIVLIATTLFLAYTNGANDNFKGVATLFGSKTTGYNSAISWATITTFVGSLTAIFFANELIQNFSGKGLVPDALVQVPSFAISVALAAAFTIFTASKIGMPISTTHALVGSLLGVGLIAVGFDFNFLKLGTVFLIPLLVSPLLAAALSYVAYKGFKFMRQKIGISKSNCLCLNEDDYHPLNRSQHNASIAVSNTKISLVTCKKELRTEIYDGEIFGITIQNVLDRFHFLSAGVVCFARGLNDTPKILGLLLIVDAFNIPFGMLMIGIAMAIGGIINAKKVGMTMAEKITPMNSGQGFTANLITGLLVTTASIFGLPVSTTHVSVGSIYGIGRHIKKSNNTTISRIVLSWLVTLPVAALFGVLIFKILTVLI